MDRKKCIEKQMFDDIFEHIDQITRLCWIYVR